MGKMTKEEAGEEFRLQLIRCMQKGYHLVVNLSTTIVKFSDYDSDELPFIKMITIPDNLDKNYMQLVKDEENYDVLKKAKGCYSMHIDFMIIFYTNAENEEFDDSMVQMAIDCIPNVAQMAKLYIQHAEKMPGVMEAR